MHLRRANSADIPAMMLIEQESPSAADWSQAQHEAMFATDDPAFQRSGWVVESSAQEKVSTEPTVLLGFLIAHKIDGEWELENIVVAEKARRRGVGTRLLTEFIEHVSLENGSAIFLEVRASNHVARSIYRKAGFEETGVRRNYYSNPPESAILYRRRIS
ncbi:MAG: ribosomal protein S18-alanine N-acetyltransferase [Candidatus Sulfotelmatobacter sp.]